MSADITAEGYTPELHIEGWEDHLEVKALLQAGYLEEMVGALFVGDIPIAWYEMEDWFDGTSYGWTEFPIELYYMDLDGTWIDNNPANGLYDNHTNETGDLEPEIWVGRLYASTLTISGETEISLIQNYFDKNHEYRMGNLSLYNRALVYVDDDWYDYADGWSNDMDPLYGNRTLVKDQETTVADDYKNRLVNNYDWISLFAHSAWHTHGLIYNGGTQWSWVDSIEISSIDPVAHFYNLFCCSGGDYSNSGNNGNLAGHYIFSKTHGLCAIASTKTGSMLNFADFYTPLANGASIGEAFLDWFIWNGETGALEDSRSWFYGMTIAGDPTLDTFDDVLPEPPTDLDITISGDDAYLTWEGSASPDIHHYLIYRAVDPKFFDFSTPLHNTSFDPNPLACTWTDPLAATSDSYFYVVRAVDYAMNEDDNAQKLGFYNIQMAMNDWSLVSVPLPQVSDDILDVFENAEWNYAMWYDITDEDHWKTYATFKPSSLNDLDTVNRAMGVWLRGTTSDRLTVIGTEPQQTVIQLKAGWNLVGYPSLTTKTVSEALLGISYDGVESFDAVAPYRISQMSPTDLMEPGRGYWIHVTADTVWTIDW